MQAMMQIPACMPDMIWHAYRGTWGVRHSADPDGVPPRARGAVPWSGNPSADGGLEWAHDPDFALWQFTVLLDQRKRQVSHLEVPS